MCVYVYVYIYVYIKDSHDVMITVIGNGLSDMSSNPGQHCILHNANTLGNGM